MARCKICNRPLTSAESKRRGMGPECYSKKMTEQGTYDLMDLTLNQVKRESWLDELKDEDDKQMTLF